MNKYRIVTNGKWYEIEYKIWWLPPFWHRRNPSMYRYTPIDWSDYRFKTVKEAEEKIKELKKAKELSTWEVVNKYE